MTDFSRITPSGAIVPPAAPLPPPVVPEPVTAPPGPQRGHDAYVAHREAIERERRRGYPAIDANAPVPGTGPHKPFVYVAGPIGSNPNENAHHAITFYHKLLNDGLVAPFCPHLSVYAHIFNPRDYNDWLAYDFEIISRCDALYRLEGESPGADAEVDHALRLGLPVFYAPDLMDTFYPWARTWLGWGSGEFGS